MARETTTKSTITTALMAVVSRSDEIKIDVMILQ